MSAVLPVQSTGVNQAQIRLMDQRAPGATEVGSFIPLVLPPKLMGLIWAQAPRHEVVRQQQALSTL